MDSHNTFANGGNKAVAQWPAIFKLDRRETPEAVAGRTASFLITYRIFRTFRICGSF